MVWLGHHCGAKRGHPRVPWVSPRFVTALGVPCTNAAWLLLWTSDAATLEAMKVVTLKTSSFIVTSRS